MKKPEKFWNRFAARYAKSPISNEAAYQKKLELTRTYLSKESRVFEIACGTGMTAVAHAPFVKHIDAIDVSEKMLDFARERARAANVSNVTFTCANIETLPRPREKYDVVMAHSILHLLDNPDAVIAMVHDMLKPGGVFVSGTICITGRKTLLRMALGIGKGLGLMPALGFMSEADLVQSLQTAGFTIEHRSHPENSRPVFIVARK